MLNPIRSSLQFKIVLGLVLSLLIPIAIITTYATDSISRSAVERAQAAQRATVAGQAEAIDVLLEDAGRDVLATSRTPVLRDYVETFGKARAPLLLPSVVNLLTSNLLNTPGYYDLHVSDTTGQYILYMQKAPDGSVRTNPYLLTETDDESFRRTSSAPAGQLYAAALALERRDGRAIPYLQFSVPLFKNSGQRFGVMSLRVDASVLLSNISPLDADGTKTYVVDANGAYLIHPESGKRYGPLNGLDLTIYTEKPNDGVTILSSKAAEGLISGSEDRPETLQVYRRIRVPDFDQIQWTVLREVEIDTVLSGVYNVRIVIILLTLGALLLATIVGLLTTRRVVRPLRDLSAVANAISRGDWDKPIPQVRTRDELNLLSTAFERMVTELRGMYTTLEARVQERTNELQIANRDLTAAKALAEQSSRAKSIFLSNMSHELRTPLNVVIGYSTTMLTMPQLYTDQKLPAPYQADVELIRENGYYLLGLINDVLDLSKVEAEKLELRLQRVELNMLFRAVLANAIGLVKDKPLLITPEYPDALPPVWADPMRVRQILLNLVSNAIKFTNSGSVTLRAQVVDELIEISVSDTGIGMSEETLAHVFDRFQQAGNETELQYGGTGLGLDISRQLAKLHGSDLSVQSAPGRGTTFTFRLPLFRAEQIPDLAATQSPSGSITTLTPADLAINQTILILEPNADARDRLRIIARDASYNVVDVAAAPQLLDAATGLLPDLIVCGVHEPDEGRSLLALLRAEPDLAAIPIILVSANPTAEAARSPGAAAYLASPIQREALLQQFARLLTFAPA